MTRHTTETGSSAHVNRVDAIRFEITNEDGSSARRIFETVESHFATDGDPIGLIQALGSQGVQPYEYDRMIPVIEKSCLKKVKLLERYELSMRGDCHKTSDDVVSFYEGKCFGAVRNKRLKLSSQRNRQTALGAMLAEIIARQGVAKEYERKKVENDAMPYLIYGFREFGGDQQGEMESIGNYFVGHGDDTGNIFRNTHVLKLREQPAGRVEVFPYNPPTLQLSAGGSTVTREGTKRRARYRASGTQVSLYFDHFLNRSDTYFNALVYAHAILNSIEVFERQSI